MIKAKLTLHLLTNDKNLVSTVLNRAFFLPTYNNMPSEAPVPVPSAPSRNIEIKARLSGEGRFENLVKKARELTGSDGVLIEQHDVFYKVPQGRLKLRFLKVNFVLLGKSIIFFFYLKKLTYFNRLAIHIGHSIAARPILTARLGRC